MKRIIFVICAILVASLSLSAQERKRHIEKNGFEWFETINGDKRGVESADGKEIVPCEFDEVRILQLDSLGVLSFYGVNSDLTHSVGLYRMDGKELIPINRGYKGIMRCYTVPGSGLGIVCLTEDGTALCDADGKEVIVAKDMGLLSHHYQEGRLYYDYAIVKDDKHLYGILDCTGKVIVKAKTEEPVTLQGHDFVVAGKKTAKLTGIKESVDPFCRPTELYLRSTLNYLSEKELQDGSEIKDGYKWYLTTFDGAHGAADINGNVIVSPIFESVWYNPFSGGFEGRRGDIVTLFTVEGKCIFDIDREYTSILQAEDEYYGPYYVVYQGESAGACDAEGVNIVPPTRGYDNVQLTKAGETVYAIVEKGNMMGICDRWGKEIVPPQYQELGLTNSGTFAYIDDSGQGHDLGIRPDGTKPSSDYASTSSSSYDAKAEKKQARRAAWAAALGALAAGGAAVAASRMGTPGAAYTMPQVNPYGTGSVAGAIAGTDRIMANAQQNIQRIGQQAMNQVQQGVNRSQRALQEQLGWATNFNAQNGRYPTQLEQDEWMRQHYPDVYQVMIQARAAQTVREGSVESGSSNESTGEKKVSNTYKCSYCNGSGRLLQEDDVLRFGLPSEKDYKCQECGNWKYKGMTHRHYDCPHCKGTGKRTFD